jgi:aspartate racemase
MITDHSTAAGARNVEGRGAGYTLGILGGLGPLASAEFLKTIYEYNSGAAEQTLPRVVLYSDPTFPDRTETLLGGSHDALLARLAEALRSLCGLGVSEVAICCVTIHHLLPRLPDELRAKTISLVEVALAETIRRRQRQLLMCTYGSRKLGVFESHALWAGAREFIVLPDEADQQEIHSMIYDVKRGAGVEPMWPVLDALLAKYEADSFLAGCTEMHLFSKRAAAGLGARRYACIDPLISIARGLCRADTHKVQR